MKEIGIVLLLWCGSAAAETVSPGNVVKDAWEAVSKTYIEMPAQKAEWEKARAEYVGKTYNTQEQAHAAIRDMLATLHSSRLQWLSAKDAETIMAQFRARPPKLGLAFLSFEFLPGQKKVITALASSPAAEAGVCSRDVLDSVNGTVVRAMSPGELVRLLDRAGERPASLVVVREGKNLNILVKPSDEALKFVSWGADREHMHLRIEVTLREFTVPAVEEFRAMVASFGSSVVDDYTIDVRNNPGGLLDAVREIAALFISDKEFMCKKNAAGETSCEKTKAGYTITAPVTILVNEGTASAAEIFAAGFQRSKRGQVIGCRSHGHGYGGQLTKLSDGSSLLIPDSSFLDPDGQPLEGRGITPDLVKCPAS